MQALVTILLGAIIVFIYSFIKRKNKPRTTVLGIEQSKADAEEKKRVQETGNSNSAFAGMNYSDIIYSLNLLDPVENSVDHFLQNFCKNYVELPFEEKAAIRNSVNQDDIYTLLTFIKRSCVFCLRKNDVSYVKDGLTAITIIDKKRVDFRDVLSALAFLYHTFSRLNINADEEFNAVADKASPETKELIIGFAQKDKKSKNLKTSWGYEEIETENGIGFIGYEFRKFYPELDLKRIALLIASFIQSDNYYYGEITVGTELPLFWLGLDDNNEILKIIKSAKGFLEISSKPLTEKINIFGKQMLLIYVGEMNSVNDADILYSASSQNDGNKFAKLEIKIDNVFCLLIARSMQEGVKNIESNESLTRFEKPIQEIILKVNRPN